MKTVKKKRQKQMLENKIYRDGYISTIQLERKSGTALVSKINKTQERIFYVTKILSAFSKYVPKSISDSDFFKLEANLEKIVQEIQKGK